MRILQLDFIRFGIFSDVTLDFSRATANRPGVHLIYGPNEAGKSTARQALRCALYGFPHRTALDFRHQAAKLRLGVTLEDGDGRRFSFVRRKGNKKTCLDPTSGEPISEEMLAQCLVAARDADAFERAFAFNHEQLRAGGEELMRGEETGKGGSDSLARILLVARTGLTNLRTIEKSYLDEAQKLFLPNGKIPLINAAVETWKRLDEKRKESEAKADDYRRIETSLEEARRQAESLGHELAKARTEKQRLERLQGAAPQLAHLAQRQAEREKLGHVPVLEANFSHKRSEAQQQAATAQVAIAQIDQQRETLEAELEDLTVPEALLAQAETIDRLGNDWTLRQQEDTDSKGLRGQVTSLERQIDQSLKAIGRVGEAGEGDLLLRQDAARIRQLAAERDKLGETLKTAREEARDLREELGEAEGQLAALGEPVSLDSLAAGIRAAGRLGEIDQRIWQCLQDRDGAQIAATTALDELPLWKDEAAALTADQPPDEAIVKNFQGRFADLDRRGQRLADRRERIEQQRDQTQHELATTRGDADPPSEQTLQEARRRREIGWREIRRELEGRAPGPERDTFLGEFGTESLIAAYEQAVRAADDIADRLRREAETISNIARLEADLAKNDSQRQRLEYDEQTLETEQGEAESQWRDLWPFLDAPPLPPAEMQSWTTKREAALGKLAMVAEHAEELAELTDRRTDCREKLLRELQTLGTRREDLPSQNEAELAGLLERAEAIHDEIQGNNQRRDALITKVKENHPKLVRYERRIEETQAELDAADREWIALMATLELPPATTNAAAEAVLDTLADAEKLRDRQKETQLRIEQMRQNRERFDADLVALMNEIAPQRRGEPPEKALAELREELEQARQQRSRQVDRQQQLAKENQKRNEKETSLTEARAALSLFCQQAGIEDPEQLPTIEKRVTAAGDLDRQIDKLRQTLLDSSGGRPQHELEAELAAIEFDAIGPRIQELDGQIADLEGRQRDASTEFGSRETELAQFRGGAAAAEISSHMEGLQAQLARQVERYARARIASWLLREARRRYRERSEDQLLKRSPLLFQQLTCGAFTKLRYEFDEKENDKQILIGVRGNGDGEVDPDGMSDGTRDQLFLALRVAAWHAWLDNHQPLPIVVDDLLINFDDQRAAAALGVLADLAQRTQILVFTHHQHLREIARQAIPPDVLHEHELAFPFAQNGSAIVASGS